MLQSGRDNLMKLLYSMKSGMVRMLRNQSLVVFSNTRARERGVVLIQSYKEPRYVQGALEKLVDGKAFGS